MVSDQPPTTDKRSCSWCRLLYYAVQIGCDAGDSKLGRCAACASW